MGFRGKARLGRIRIGQGCAAQLRVLGDLAVCRAKEKRELLSVGPWWELATSRGGPLPPRFGARLSPSPHQAPPASRTGCGAIARCREHRDDVGHMGSLRLRLRPRDSYLHRSGLAPSPAVGYSPRRLSEAGGSCALSCSSLGRTSAWWGAATAGTAALPL